MMLCIYNKPKTVPKCAQNSGCAHKTKSTSIEARFVVSRQKKKLNGRQ